MCHLDFATWQPTCRLRLHHLPFSTSPPPIANAHITRTATARVPDVPALAFPFTYACHPVMPLSPDRLLTTRQKRVHRSLARLHAHPSVNPPPPPAPALPAGLIRALFDDLVKREMRGFAPVRGEVEQHLRRNRAVAPRPSLSDARFVSRLASGYCPAVVGGKLAKEVGGVRVDREALSPTAGQIHRAIRAARESKITGMKRFREERREAEEKEKKAAVEEGGERDNDDEATQRRTRGAAKKAWQKGRGGAASECCFCPPLDVFGGEELDSELVGPFVDARGRGKLHVHFDCACWAPQVFADSKSGQLRGVYDEHKRGRRLNCCECGGKGATIGCYVKNCKRVFHFRCLKPAGAFRVERFFAAFCENHAHLGKKKSYQILMEAATIADVAASRREDTTVGLDAPHSRYTMLRRRETEVVFSRKMGVCSHAGAYETGKVIFSHRRRAVLKKSDRLSIADGTRALLVSAFDIASGRLAYMAVGGDEKHYADMTAVEARAALASRENTSLLLLRNLRHAPKWTKAKIKVVKRTGADVNDELLVLTQEGDRPGNIHLAQMGPAAKLAAEEDDNVLSVPPIEDQVDQEDEMAKPSSENSAPVRRSKRSRSEALSSSDDNALDLSLDSKNNSASQLTSTALPSFAKKMRASVPLKLRIKSATDSPTESASDGSPPRLESEERIAPGQEYVSEKRLPKSSPKRRRGALSISKEGLNARQGLVGKIKTAWETFLEEQLPKERLLRPDDTESDALRNMARLWSLLDAEAREEYQQRGRRAGAAAHKFMSSADLEKQDDENDCGSANKKDVEESLPTATGSSLKAHLNDPGLFVAKPSRTVSRGAVGKKEKNKRTDRKRVLSVPLPRRGRAYERIGLTPRLGELVAIDWEDLLPTSLDEGGRPNSKGGTVERVRSPPSRFRRK